MQRVGHLNTLWPVGRVQETDDKVVEINLSHKTQVQVIEDSPDDGRGALDTVGESGGGDLRDLVPLAFEPLQELGEALDDVVVEAPDEGLRVGGRERRADVLRLGQGQADGGVEGARGAEAVHQLAEAVRDGLVEDVDVGLEDITEFVVDRRQRGADEAENVKERRGAGGSGC